MSKLSTGSLCLTTLLEQAKLGHSAFSKADNGKIYFNVTMWQNDEVDKFGNTFALSLNSKKEKQEVEAKCYIGNLKYVEKKETPIVANDLPSEKELNDLPF